MDSRLFTPVEYRRYGPFANCIPDTQTIPTVATRALYIFWIANGHSQAEKFIERVSLPAHHGVASRFAALPRLPGRLGVRSSSEGRRCPARFNAGGDVQYLKGRFHWNKRTEEGLNTGIRCFEDAIAVDPGYAPAYSGVAGAYAMLGTRGALAPDKAIHCAEPAVQKALMLDSHLAEIGASAALPQSMYHRNWHDAEREFVRAFTLNLRYGTARHWYAVTCLPPLGRLGEGIDHLRTALEFEPVSLFLHIGFRKNVVISTFLSRGDQAAQHRDCVG